MTYSKAYLETHPFLAMCEELKDQTKVPTRFPTPRWGSGLLTTGTALKPAGSFSCDDCGERYGYCFQPLIYSEPSAGGFATTMSGSKYGFNPELQGDQDRSMPWGVHPYLATLDEAVEWLRSRGLEGCAQRYAHHRHVEERGPTWDFDSFEKGYRWKQYYPWITAGIPAHVTHEQDRIWGSLGDQFRGFILYNPDGSVREVNGGPFKS